jgi:hypothetical protein
MVNITEEIRTNYLAFSQTVSTSLVSNIATFKENSRLVESYARIAAINALKVDVVEPHVSAGAAHFFFEAHNDALISHVNASFGSWRPALQALRSFMENTMAAIYYFDHPVEFEKWGTGAFQISPRELREYTVGHPRLIKLVKELNLKSVLDNEYGTLSKAVHGSSTLFRMTGADGKTNFANASLVDLGKWSARERNAVDCCITALVGVLSIHLEGSKRPSLRAALSNAIQAKSRSALKKHMSVSIPSP